MSPLSCNFRARFSIPARNCRTIHVLRGPVYPIRVANVALAEQIAVMLTLGIEDGFLLAMLTASETTW